MKASDVATFDALVHGRVQPVLVILRALALLALHRGESAAVVAVTVRLSPQAVRNIAARYRRTGLEHALYERRRPGAAEVLGTPDKQRIIAMVCTDQPTGATRWTVRLIAEQVVKRELVPHVGRETIRVPLQRHDLKPWREKMWCLADLDAAYIANMEDPLALYESPYRAEEPVICLDEKPVSLYAEVRTPRPARPGHVAKRDRDYRRGGTANRTSAAFARMVGTAIAAYPAARTMHCVMDTLNTHREQALTDHYGLEEGHRLWHRLTVHHTPKHGSWHNQAAIERNLVSRQGLGTRRIDAFRTLRTEVRAWTRRANRRKTTIPWCFTRTDARRKFGYIKPVSKRSKTWYGTPTISPDGRALYCVRGDAIGDNLYRLSIDADTASEVARSSTRGPATFETGTPVDGRHVDGSLEVARIESHWHGDRSRAAQLVERRRNLFYSRKPGNQRPTLWRQSSVGVQKRWP